MATKKQRARSALKNLGVLLLDGALRGEIAPELASFFGFTKQLRNDDEVFKAQLKVGHENWKSQQSQHTT